MIDLLILEKPKYILILWNKTPIIYLHESNEIGSSYLNKCTVFVITLLVLWSIYNSINFDFFFFVHIFWYFYGAKLWNMRLFRITVSLFYFPFFILILYFFQVLVPWRGPPLLSVLYQRKWTMVCQCSPDKVLRSVSLWGCETNLLVVQKQGNYSTSKHLHSKFCKCWLFTKNTQNYVAGPDLKTQNAIYCYWVLRHVYSKLVQFKGCQN